LCGGRAVRHRQEGGALSGLPPTPSARGHPASAPGSAKAGTAHRRARALEMAWGWRRFAPQRVLTSGSRRAGGLAGAADAGAGGSQGRASCSGPGGGLSRRGADRTVRPAKRRCGSPQADGRAARGGWAAREETGCAWRTAREQGLSPRCSPGARSAGRSGCSGARGRHGEQVVGGREPPRRRAPRAHGAATQAAILARAEDNGKPARC
jgi:hypothetical protein